MADHLFRIENGEPPTGVNDQLPDANLFSMELLKEDFIEEREKWSGEHKWTEEDVTVCLEGYMVICDNQRKTRENRSKNISSMESCKQYVQRKKNKHT